MPTRTCKLLLSAEDSLSNSTEDTEQSEIDAMSRLSRIGDVMRMFRTDGSRRFTSAIVDIHERDVADSERRTTERSSSTNQYSDNMWHIMAILCETKLNKPNANSRKWSRLLGQWLDTKSVTKSLMKTMEFPFRMEPGEFETQQRIHVQHIQRRMASVFGVPQLLFNNRATHERMETIVEEQNRICTANVERELRSAEKRRLAQLVHSGLLSATDTDQRGKRHGKKMANHSGAVLTPRLTHANLPIRSVAPPFHSNLISLRQKMEAFLKESPTSSSNMETFSKNQSERSLIHKSNESVSGEENLQYGLNGKTVSIWRNDETKPQIKRVILLKPENLLPITRSSSISTTGAGESRLTLSENRKKAEAVILDLYSKAHSVLGGFRNRKLPM